MAFPRPEPPKPQPKPRSNAPAEGTPAKAAVRRSFRPEPLPSPPDVQPLPVSAPAEPGPPAELGDADLVGAITAGADEGAGGNGFGSGRGPCDMVRRLQDALRRDGRIQAAVARAHLTAARAGRAIMVWNGDWVRSSGEDGKGLAGVRQAIMVEVAFAPEACRAQPVHGLVLISLGEGPSVPGLALGSGVWRWSDLLFSHGGAPISQR